MKKLKHIGLDVHAHSIAVAVADAEGVRSLGKFPHDMARLRRELKKLGRPETLRICYEAGPTGYGLCRELRRFGYVCEVIAPSLIPKQPGERIKTDRRDAENLARLSRAGLLTAITVPGPQQEALRALVRGRESAKKMQKRAMQQLCSLLLSQGRRKPTPMTNGTEKHMRWLRAQTFDEVAMQDAFEDLLAEYEHQRQRVKRLEDRMVVGTETLPEDWKKALEALMGFKGIAFLSAVTIISEIGDMMRFAHPTQLMSYAGMVPSEHSSGERVRRGALTKTGNAHLRRIVGEAAWTYTRGRRAPALRVAQRRQGLSPQVVAILERADERLHRRFGHLVSRGKARNKAASAVARELLGFIWAVAVQAQMEHYKGGSASLHSQTDVASGATA